jgi:hypothetical protein
MKILFGRSELSISFSLSQKRKLLSLEAVPTQGKRARCERGLWLKVSDLPKCGERQNSMMRIEVIL